MPVTVPSGTMSPGCYLNDCTGWGAQKALDGVETGLKSLAHTSDGVNPYITFNLGSVRSDLDAVRLLSRVDCCWARASNLNMYLTATPSFQSSTPFAVGVGANALAQTATVAVPDGLSGQYLTIQRNTSGTPDSINIQEFTVLASGMSCTCRSNVTQECAGTVGTAC